MYEEVGGERPPRKTVGVSGREGWGCGFFRGDCEEWEEIGWGGRRGVWVFSWRL
jgi:hypothetical protein